MGVTWTDTDSSSGETINASLINNIRDDIGSYLTTGIPNADLANPEHLVVFGPVCLQTLGSGETEKFVFRAPVALVPVSLSIYFESGSGTLSVDVEEAGTTILSTPATEASADTIDVTTSFADTTIAANADISLHIDETAASALTNVCVTLICKAEHTT